MKSKAKVFTITQAPNNIFKNLLDCIWKKVLKWKRRSGIEYCEFKDGNKLWSTDRGNEITYCILWLKWRRIQYCQKIPCSPGVFLLLLVPKPQFCSGVPGEPLVNTSLQGTRWWKPQEAFRFNFVDSSKPSFMQLCYSFTSLNNWCVGVGTPYHINNLFIVGKKN